MAIFEAKQRQPILSEFYPASLQIAGLPEELQRLQRAFPDVGSVSDVSLPPRAVALGATLLLAAITTDPALAQSGDVDGNFLRDLLSVSRTGLIVGGATTAFELVDGYFTRHRTLYRGETQRGSTRTEIVANGIAGYIAGKTFEMMAHWYATDMQKFVESLVVMSGAFGIVYVTRTKYILDLVVDKAKDGFEDVANRVVHWWRGRFGGESEAQDEGEEEFLTDYEPGEDHQPPRHSSF